MVRHRAGIRPGARVGTRVRPGARVGTRVRARATGNQIGLT